MSFINNPVTVGPLPHIMFDNQPTLLQTSNLPQASQCQLNVKQENCSALSQHLFDQVKNMPFNTAAEVAEWCQLNIKVDIF
jgi:hypothetical protein